MVTILVSILMKTEYRVTNVKTNGENCPNLVERTETVGRERGTHLAEITQKALITRSNGCSRTSSDCWTD